MELRIKKLKENAAIPKRQTIGSAGYDLCACIEEEICLRPGEGVLVPIGIAMEIPEGYAGFVFSRSGMGIKYGIHASNGVGVVDSDYRGEIMVGLRNYGGESYTIRPGDRIAQIVIMRVESPELSLSDELTETERGTGGFGSTGS